MTHLAGLIEKLERATGHDDALNDAIAVQQGWTPHRTTMDGETFTTWITPTGEKRTLCPWYTSSLDAALMLVPEGFQAYVYTGTPEGAHACVWTDYPHRISGGARQCTNPAIALCIAALKARTPTLTQPSQDTAAE